MKRSFSYIMLSNQNRINMRTVKTQLSSVADLRKEYSRKGLDESDIPSSPLLLFKMWFDEACAAEVIEVR